MAYATQYTSFPLRIASTTQNGTTTTSRSFALVSLGSVTFGAAGAVFSYVLPSGATVTKGATGTYAFAGLPAGSLGMVRATPVQALATATQWRVTAFDSAAGTATLVHSAGGSDADPASADSVQLEFTVLSGG